MKPLETREIMQIGIVVKDIEKSAVAYAKLFGMDMPNIRGAFPTITYRGQKITTHSRLCSFPMGAISLELIQPDDGPSSWREYLEEHGEGVHHVGLMVSDLDEAYASLSDMGIEKRQFGGAAWGSYTIMDSVDLGVLLNIKCAKPVAEGDGND